MPVAHKEFGRELGPFEISRRDMLNGVLLAVGAGAVSQSVPFRALAAQAEGAACDGAIGSDPRALRGGNLPSAFNVGHWMRDRRLRFERGTVTLAKGCDDVEGAFPIVEDDKEFDVVVAGAGLAGLSACFCCGDVPESAFCCSKPTPTLGAMLDETTCRRCQCPRRRRALTASRRAPAI